MEDHLTLALSFNTRKIGLAVFQSHHLIDYHLQHHKSAWSSRKRDHILASLQSCCDLYNITYIVLSIDHDYYQTEGWRQVLSSFLSFANMKGIPHIMYQVCEIYKFFGCPVRRKREPFMHRLSSLIPELQEIYDKEKRNKHKHYIKLFEAIAAGAYHKVQA